MRRAIAILFIVLPFCWLAATDVSGNQSGTWTLANSPYNIIGDVTVPAGDSLSIEPGVEVFVMGNYRLKAEGKLTAVGTEADTIRFRSGQADPGALWKGIRLENESLQSQIRRCYIEKAEYGVNAIDSPVLISHCRFNLNDKGMQLYGIGSADPATMLVQYNIVENSIGNGILISQNSNALIEYNEVRFNGTGSQYRGAIQLSNQSAGGSNSPMIRYNHIHHNHKQGITAWDIQAVNAIQPHILENVIEYNLTGIYLLNASGYVADNIIRHNFIPGDANSGAGVMVAGATSEPYFERNIIHGNFTGFYLGNNAKPCLGNLDIYHAWAQGENQIYDNIDGSNIPHSVYTYSYTTPGLTIWAENNSWGTNDPAEIAIGINDQNDDPSLPLVDFEPILPIPVPTTVTGSVSYTGAFSLTNHRVQIVGADSGEIYYEEPVSPDQPFTLSQIFDGQFHVVVMADVEGVERVFYGTPGGLLTPETFSPDSLEPIEVGVIQIQETQPPRFQDVGSPEQIGAHLCYPVYHRFFVYRWDHINWLYESGDYVFLKRHERFNEAGNIIFNFADEVVWDKISGIEHNNTWLRTEILNDSGAQRVSMFRAKIVTTASDGSNTHMLILQSDTVNQQLISVRVMDEGLSRVYHYNAGYLANCETVVGNIVFQYLHEGNWWFYQPLLPVYQPTGLCVDQVEHFVESPWALTLYWQAPADDGIYNWTHYRVYNYDTLLAEVPFLLNSWHSNNFNYQVEHCLTVCAFDGVNESPRTNEVLVSHVSASDPGAVPPTLVVGPNPASIGAGGRVEVSIKSSAPLNGRLGVYNLRGQLVETVPVASEGDFAWHWGLLDAVGERCASGIYLFRAELEGQPTLQKRLVLIR
ncbi:MAG TPA: right-handed parallel beta-helix repeat-containing protein [Candidatus Syntrophosphaera sp.]|nr:right-handed parallel beta-helix repeat-containing protein [Candidatus Syntrophosphaera sp.]